MTDAIPSGENNEKRSGAVSGEKSSLSKWMRATIDNKPWWAIVVAACLASLGSEGVKNAPALISSVRSLFPIEPTILVILKNKGAGPPMNGPRISILDARTRTFVPIVGSSDTFVTMKDGIASLKVRLVAQMGYLVVLEYADGNKIYRHSEPIDIAGDTQFPLAFDRDTWPPRELVFQNAQGVSPNAIIEAPATLPPWMKVAYGELGQRKIAGPVNNERILEYFQSTGLTNPPKDDETSWDTAFVSWVLKQSGISGPASLRSRSWMTWGVATPLKPGCIAVFWRVSPQSEFGHVGFVVSVQPDGNSLAILGGNQNNSVNIAHLPRSNLLGCRMPG